MTLVESNVKSKEISDDYNNGLSIGQIQRKYRCGTNKIYKAFVLFGIQSRLHEKIDFSTIRHEYTILNMSTTEIAEKHNMSPSSIWERLKKGGVKLRDQKQEALKAKIKIPISEHCNICERYIKNKNESCGDIAKDYDVHKSTIADILKKNNIKPGTRRLIDRRNDIWQDQERLAKLYKAGVTILELTKIYDVSDTTVRNVLEKSPQTY